MTTDPQPLFEHYDDGAPTARPSADPSPGPYQMRGGAIFAAAGGQIGTAAFSRDGTNMANARLFAASWELLEAARNVMSRILEIDHDALESDECTGCLATEAMRAAIAKAEGRQS